ncbi:hypothetical protein PMIN06_006212 [Paraphaeosphaeria minitans]|uniref:Meiotically up-regulated 65 protein n=1 Tax=Paraphaeosphaeria minitans TaxID=565426 RepID=A0A9P6GWG9_9PLEO|nr:meiotically up-regulated 65 protein [Paraphaeosphaeria minitans]
MADQHIALVDATDNEHSPERTQQPTEQTRKFLQTPDLHIDVLYENQRGWFVFGIPLFSSKALWNLRIDQSPWVDAKFKPSAVNITNAQVPDPSWVWEWKSWYVDMSHDVDEEGWQYSLWFKGAAWHGNHPWFHSFVRRRRWLRKRVKQRLPPKSKVNERLFGDTFSIGTTLARAMTSTTSPMSPLESGESSLDEEVKDVPTLMRKLKNAAIDREKIVFINRFIEDGGEELHYLAEQIPTIMSLLIFQNSRRQLLSTLMETIDDARTHRGTHKERGKPENEVEERRINNLLKAVEAADAECKKLEYWSDIKILAEEGNAGHATDPNSGWDEKWQGLDSSGAEHPRQPLKKE